MAISFTTQDSRGLLAAFNQAIHDGNVTTWERSDDDEYYTHKAANWAMKAWFKPELGSDRLTFNIIRPQNANVTVLVYAYYHGHLSETFLNHFDQAFGHSISSAFPESGDNCNA
jgi:hypothetical protein